MHHHDRTLPLHISCFLKYLFGIGGVYAALGVAFQAVAAHMPAHAFLPPHGREMVHTAADIALWHGIALCALTLGASKLHPLRLTLGCAGLALGTCLFSISVTLHGFGILFPARLAPIGGSLLILSWFCIASAAIIRTR